MSDRLKAWVHYKRKDKLSEDDSLFVDDIESLIIENENWEKEYERVISHFLELDKVIRKLKEGKND